MNQPSGEIDLDDFLISSPLCDSDNPDLIQKAQDLTKNLPNDKEKAIKIFYFLRDKIPFNSNQYFKSASEVLQMGYGDCLSKSNLQIAMLRAIKIPARFNIIILKNEVLKPFFPKWAYKRISEEDIHHAICECFLDGKWIDCDSTFDRMLLDGARSKGLIEEKNMFSQIDWDGEHNVEALSHLKIGEVGIYATFDKIWEKARKEDIPPKFIGKIGEFIINRHINKIRKK